ncbi:MAG: PEGA domain-containing protein, partial [Proteobacteria bacterium]|nr:PEGA domain-containing protein [Pseudomonadota bacterium]
EMAELEQAAAKGALSTSGLSCIKAFIADENQQMTDRRTLARVGLVNDKAICDAAKQCKNYEESQEFYFNELGRYDIDMMYIWVRYLSERPNQTIDRQKEIVLWCNRALERKQDWNSVKYVKHVEKLLGLRAHARHNMLKLAIEQGYPEEGKYRTEVRADAMEWANFVLQLGKNADEALALCAEAMGDTSKCTTFQHDLADKTVVTFVSIPLGARVFLDGAQVGVSPLPHETPAGTHVLRMEVQDSDPPVASEITIEVGANEAIRHLWRSGEDKWESSF